MAVQPQSKNPSPPPSTIKVQENPKSKNRLELKILHFNCRGLTSEERLWEFENELNKIKWEIVGLAEVRKKGEELVKRKNGNYFYYFGETAGQKGVGWYIKGEIWNKIVEIKKINERICMLKLELEEKINISIIQVYAPTLDSTEEEKNLFYGKLIETLEKEKEFYTVIMGDWNSKTGKRNSDECCMGMFGIGDRNENGDRLIDFALNYNLKIANTFFNKKESRKWTWVSPNRLTRNEIDHFLINDRSVVRDVSVLANFNFPSDHRIVRIKLEIPNKAKMRRWCKFREEKKVVIPVYKVSEAKEYMKKEFEKAIKSGGQKGVQEKYDNLVMIIKETERKFGEEKKECRTDDKISRNTKDLIERRGRMGKIRKMTPVQKVEWAELRKLIRKEIRKDCKLYEERRVIEIIEETWSTKKVWRELTVSRKVTVGLKDKGGKMITNRESLLNEATDFYKKLYAKSDTEPERGRTEDQLEEESDIFPPILKEEIEYGIKSLKKGKAPGLDKIDNETIKTFAAELIDPLESILTDIVEEETIPRQWKESEIILIPKKGDKHDLNNYRPISLTSNKHKLFAKILKNRIYNQLEANQSPEQAGFRKGFSTVDHIHTLNQLIEKAREYQIEMHLIFIDFRKAFDTVSQGYLWRALRRQRIDRKAINLIENSYAGAKARIKLDKAGKFFNVERGVKQGDPLSPNLFNALLEEIFRGLNWEKKGLRVQGKNLNHLRFADDIVLISESKAEIQEMCVELVEESQKRGLEFNIDKTKYMSNIEGGEICIGGNKLEKVKEYVYLGQIMSFEEKMDKEINARKNQAWKAYWSLKRIFKSKMSLKAKMKIMVSCIVPVIVYGAQTWNLTQKQTNNLQSLQRRIIRSIMGIKRSERVRNEELMEKAGMEDITTTVRKLKIKYAGHLAREDHNKWCKSVTEWTPYECKRRRGRPGKRWRDEIEQKLGVLWGRSAQDRRVWQKIGEAYALERASGKRY